MLKNGKHVLIIEPNPYHQEILAGNMKYFKDMDYEITLLTRIDPKDSKVFSNLGFNYNLIVYKYENISEELSKIDLKKFDFVFFSSIEKGDENGLTKVIDDIKIPLCTKYGLLGAYHTTTHIDLQNSYDLYNEGRIFFLNDFTFNNKKGKMLAPIYFGNFKPKSDKNKKTRFIAIGNYSKYKIYDRWFFHIIDELIKRGHKNFEIVLIGNGEYTYHTKKRWYRPLTPLKYKKYLKVLGSLPFDKMYEEIIKSDFLLPMLDSGEIHHQHYLTKTTSGARNLCFGFNIPPVINKDFTEIYHFNDKNSISYKDNNVADGMELAINMDNKDYQTLKSKLSDTANEIYTVSLNNLKTTIDEIINKQS